MVTNKRSGTYKHWQAVRHVPNNPRTLSLRPGDILVRDGHVMIVMQRPEKDGVGWR